MRRIIGVLLGLWVFIVGGVLVVVGLAMMAYTFTSIVGLTHA